MGRNKTMENKYLELLEDIEEYVDEILSGYKRLKKKIQIESFEKKRYPQGKK